MEDVAVDEDDPLLLADLDSVLDVVLAVDALLEAEPVALDAPPSPAEPEAVLAPSDDDFFP